MTICGLSLHHGETESRKNLEQKFIFQLGTLYPHVINEHLFPLIYAQIHVTIFPPMAKLLHAPYKAAIPHNSSIRSDEGLTLETSAFISLSRW